MVWSASSRLVTRSSCFRPASSLQSPRLCFSVISFCISKLPCQLRSPSIMRSLKSAALSKNSWKRTRPFREFHLKGPAVVQSAARLWLGSPLEEGVALSLQEVAVRRACRLLQAKHHRPCCHSCRCVLQPPPINMRGHHIEVQLLLVRRRVKALPGSLSACSCRRSRRPLPHAVASAVRSWSHGACTALSQQASFCPDVAPNLHLATTVLPCTMSQALDDGPPSPDILPPRSLFRAPLHCAPCRRRLLPVLLHPLLHKEGRGCQGPSLGEF